MGKWDDINQDREQLRQTALVLDIDEYTFSDIAALAWRTMREHTRYDWFAAGLRGGTLNERDAWRYLVQDALCIERVEGVGARLAVKYARHGWRAEQYAMSTCRIVNGVRTVVGTLSELQLEAGPRLLIENPFPHPTDVEDTVDAERLWARVEAALSPSELNLVNTLAAAGSQAQAARLYGVSRSTINLRMKTIREKLEEMNIGPEL